MNTFPMLYEEELRKYDVDSDTNQDTPTLFFLYVMKEVLTTYIVFDDPFFTNNLVHCVKYRGGRGNEPLYYGDCDLSKEVEDIVNQCVFDIPIDTDPDFFIFLFRYLADVMHKTNASNMVKPCTDGNLDFPISYNYFKKIIVGMEVGEWKYLDRSGRSITVIEGHKIDSLTNNDLIKPTDGFYKKQTLFFKNGESREGKQYVSRSEAIELHAKWLAKAKDAIQHQKAVYASATEGMKAQGYPYLDTYEEYIRFLRTNLKDMRFGKFTLRVKDIFDFFIPTPLR